MRILLVEDDDLLGQGVVAGFKQQHYNVECFRQGGQALASLEHENYDAMVLDLGLPDLDGQTVASAAHDGDVRLWDVASGELISVLSGHENQVTAVSFSNVASNEITMLTGHRSFGEEYLTAHLPAKVDWTFFEPEFVDTPTILFNAQEHIASSLKPHRIV